jgi:hypothetical protein
LNPHRCETSRLRAGSQLSFVIATPTIRIAIGRHATRVILASRELYEGLTTTHRFRNQGGSRRAVSKSAIPGSIVPL